MRDDLSLWFYYVNRNPALEPFWELIEAAKEGRAPDPRAVKLIADASRVLFADGEMDKLLREFGKRLGLHTKQGKHKSETAGDVMRYMNFVGFLIQAEERLKAGGMSARAAGAKAKRDISKREGVAVRTLTEWRGKYGDRAIEMLREFRASKKNDDAASKGAF